MAVNRKSSHETYETIPETFGSCDALSEPPVITNRRRSGQLAEAQMSASVNVSSYAGPSAGSSWSSESDSVFTNSLERHSTLASPPLMGRSPISRKKQLRSTCSQNNVSPTSSMINERPPCPVPKSSYRMVHSNSSGVIEVS